jgi:membrane-associated HD superfamily phosphohydrolase
MLKKSRLPLWLIGGTLAWLAYVISLSVLHLVLMEQWGVPYTIKIYSVDPSQPFSLVHAILVAMVSPGFFLLEVISFLHIHSPWLDSAIYNWGKLTLLSSLPAFLVGALLFSSDRRLKLAGSIIGLLLLGGGLLFVLSGSFAQ